MTDKPTYLGLLNAIANAEGDAECYLGAWAAATSRDDVRQVIATVALREGEHAKAFAKRMCELGFDLQPRSDPKLDEKMSIASSTELSDREKFERLQVGRGVEQGDIFSTMFNDVSIDIQTGALLGRYIAEERDSGRMLNGCYSALCAEAGGTASTNGSGPAADGAAVAALSDRLDHIETLLTQLVSAKGSKK